MINNNINARQPRRRFQDWMLDALTQFGLVLLFLTGAVWLAWAITARFRGWGWHLFKIKQPRAQSVVNPMAISQPKHEDIQRN
jgi:hypothetical protein